MNILINFIPIKKGGGQQVATAFIKALAGFKTNTDNYYFLVTQNTFVDKLLTDFKFGNVFRVGGGNISRFKFEFFEIKRLVKLYKIDGIFTMFGPDLPKISVPSVVGCAYSNIFYPEVDFWEGFPLYKKVLLNLIDRYRKKRTFQADGIIFENEAMQKRAEKFFRYPLCKTAFIKPSINRPTSDDFPSSDFIKKSKKLPSGQKVLMLSGWHKNKNISQVPFILNELKLNGIIDFYFIITISPDHVESKKLLKIAKDLDVSENILLIGSILPTDIPFLYSKVDYILLLSLLESFSNNIIESWTFKKPLLISNLEWSRSICKDAAEYVDRDDPRNIALHLIALSNDKNRQIYLIENGENELKTYPTVVQRVIEQLNFFKKIVYEAKC